MAMASNKILAQEAAVAAAAARVRAVPDLAARCRGLGLTAPAADGGVAVRAFGRDFRLAPPDYRPAVITPGAKPARLDEQILILHYLLTERPVTATGTLITFREFPGGQFYWEPFLSRSVAPLLKRVDNDLELLRRNLQRFDTAPATGPGDLAVRVHAVGKLELTLIYHLGDDEFPPGAEVLFDTCMKGVYVAEDAAAVASRICLGLL